MFWRSVVGGIFNEVNLIRLDASDDFKKKLCHGLNLMELNSAPSGQGPVTDEELQGIKYGVLALLEDKPKNKFYIDFLRVIERAERII